MAQAKKNAAILQYVRRQEYRRRLEERERWGHVGGRIYTAAKIFYIIGFLCTLMVNLAYMLGRWLNIDEATKNPDTYITTNLSAARSALYLAAAMTLVLIAALILTLARRNLAALVCTALPAALLLVHFYQQLADQMAESGPARYLTSHVLPLAVMLAAAVVLFIIQLRERRAERVAYEKLTAELYRKHAGGDQALSDAEWEALLENYAAGIQPVLAEAGEEEARHG